MDYDPRSLAPPAELDWLRADDAGRDWLAALPGVLAEVAADWSLRVGRPYDGSKVSLVLPATLPDGSRAVLKLQFPDREAEHEAAALRIWNGDGVVRLLAHDEARSALLIEHCSPGDHLASDPEAAMPVFIDLLPRLWRPVTDPFARLDDEARRWAEHLEPAWERAGRPCERRLVDAARDTLLALAADPTTEQVLLHQDLHSYNVLSADRQPWLVIDPKPLIGERAFAVAPVVRDHELGHSRRQLRHRLDRLSAELDVDRERARRWAFGQTMVWALRGGAGMPRHLESAGWLLAAR